MADIRKSSKGRGTFEISQNLIRERNSRKFTHMEFHNLDLANWRKLIPKILGFFQLLEVPSRERFFPESTPGGTLRFVHHEK